MNRRLCKASTEKDFTINLFGHTYVIRATTEQQAVRKFQQNHALDVANIILTHLIIH